MTVWMPPEWVGGSGSPASPPVPSQAEPPVPVPRSAEPDPEPPARGARQPYSWFSPPRAPGSSDPAGSVFSDRVDTSSVRGGREPASSWVVGGCSGPPDRAGRRPTGDGRVTAAVAAPGAAGAAAAVRGGGEPGRGVAVPAAEPAAAVAGERSVGVGRVGGHPAAAGGRRVDRRLESAGAGGRAAGGRRGASTPLRCGASRWAAIPLRCGAGPRRRGDGAAAGQWGVRRLDAAAGRPG